MNTRSLPELFITFIGLLLLLGSCKEFIEPSIKKYQVFPEAPADQYQSSSYTLNFWWDDVADALTYHLQVVSQSFTAPGSLVLDTVISSNKFSINLSPGSYQWRVMALNGSSQTAYSVPRNFVVLASSIKQQSVRLSAPASGDITNQSSTVFQWGNLYGATKYRFELDTNNFVNEAAVVSNVVVPGQQFSFNFLEDQNYQWRVRAENDTAQSQWSMINSITYDHMPPAQVSLTSPLDGQTVALPVSLSWMPVSSAVRYKVYVFKSDSVSLYNGTFPTNTSTNSYSFTLGNSADKVYWKVTAIDAAGNEGQASSLRSFILK
ncbi:hypothetical protein [Mucilaginibacter sp.]|uniref:hypothetical protein n=1 Tax=Mucilaginibacter sp. TaxID=1882438 RepID=UPI003D09F65E